MSICNSRADGKAISNKSLLSFNSGLTLIIKLQMLSSTKYFSISICTGWTFNEYPAIANTFSLMAILEAIYRRCGLLRFLSYPVIKTNTDVSKTCYSFAYDHSQLIGTHKNKRLAFKWYCKIQSTLLCSEIISKSHGAV